MSNESDYYTTLGITSQATPSMIRDAFTASLANFPPEMRDPVTNPAYKELLQAYEVLSDHQRRATYDLLLAETSPFALKVDIQGSRNQISVSDVSQLLYLLIDVRPPDQNTKPHLPLNLCLVIDRSTSMQGERLVRVKSAVELIVEKLAPDDVVSIISFSDRAEVVAPAEPISNKHTLIAKLRGLLASGGTEIYQGLSVAMKELEKAPLAQYTNHLILLTDGHTYGDAEECLRLARQAAAQGIGFSAFGIGAEWNDQFLDKLVAASGGRSGFIESPTQIINYLQERIMGLGAVYAQNLRLSLDLPKSIALHDAFKLAPFSQPLTPGTNELNLGDVENRLPVSFLLELTVAPQPMETRITIPLNFLVDIPGQRVRERTFKQQFQLLVLSQETRIEPPIALVQAVKMLNIYRMNEKVWDEVEAGQVDVAATRMRRLTTRLLEAGETKLAQQAYAELERLHAMGTLSLEGRKKLKYGTRALVTRSVNQDLE